MSTAVKIDTCANRLKIAMNEAGYNITELAEKTGIHKSRISRYLKDSYLPKQDALMILGDALGVSPVWLMGYDCPPQQEETKDAVLSGKEIPLIEAFQQLNEQGQDAILAIINDYTSIPRFSKKKA